MTRNARMDAINRQIDEARGLAEAAKARIQAGGGVIDIITYERHAARLQLLLERRWKLKLRSIEVVQ